MTGRDHGEEGAGPTFLSVGPSAKAIGGGRSSMVRFQSNNSCLIFFSYGLAAALQFSMYLLTFAIWPDCQDGAPCNNSASATRAMERILNDIAPDMRDHQTDFSSFGTDPLKFSGSTHPRSAGFECVRDAISLVLDELNDFESSPTMVKGVLTFMTLDTLRIVQELMSDLLAHPISHDAIINQSVNCLANNAMLAEFACAVLADPSLRPRWLVGSSTDPLTWCLHLFLVLERLGAAGRDDPDFEAVLTIHFAKHNEALFDKISNVRAGGDVMRNVALQKWQSALTEATWVAMNKNSGVGELHEKHMAWFLGVNILEEGHVDFQRGAMSNVDMSLALAVKAMSTIPCTINGQQRLQWDLGKHWIDAYIAWNINWATQWKNLYWVVPSLVPSVACSTDSSSAVEGWVPPVRSRWVWARFVTFKAFIAFQASVMTERSNINNITHFEFDSSARDAWARISAESSSLPTPSECCGLWSLDGFWEFLASYNVFVLSPTSLMSDNMYLLSCTLVGWFSVVLVGFGAEYLIGWMILARISKKTLGGLWRVTSLVFPLMLYIAIMAQSVFGLPFVAIGLWKFGFPETMGYMKRAFSSTVPGPEKVGCFMNGIGTVLHHSATSLTLVGLSTGLFPLSRPIVVPCLFCIAQHLITLLKYDRMNAYIILVFGLEMGFEWEVFVGIPSFKTPYGLEIDRVGRSCGISMLVAHWCYLVGVVFSVVIPKRGENDVRESNSVESDDEDDERSTTIGMMFPRTALPRGSGLSLEAIGGFFHRPSRMP